MGIENSRRNRSLSQHPARLTCVRLEARTYPGQHAVDRVFGIKPLLPWAESAAACCADEEEDETEEDRRRKEPHKEGEKGRATRKTTARRGLGNEKTERQRGT